MDGGAPGEEIDVVTNVATGVESGETTRTKGANEVETGATVGKGNKAHIGAEKKE